MFWRDRPDLIADWYQKLDGLVGRIEEHAQRKGKPRIIVVSDHGFSNFNYKIHLNRWLVDHGYLATSTKGPAGNLRAVDWSRSQAYALGLNSLYLNLAGREGHGSVTAAEKEDLSRRLREELLAWRGPDGREVALKVHPQNEALEGPLAGYGPDLLVGYNSGYRASAETGLGEWSVEQIEANRDHWGADHCIEPELVPGVLFSNTGLRNYPSPSYREFPSLAIDMQLEQADRRPAQPTYNRQEDQSVVEERLRDLGYL
jgi:predicted AlkP superfamily phosphohydrolase/phosphomutase